jgi:hypothetical protein
MHVKWPRLFYGFQHTNAYVVPRTCLQKTLPKFRVDFTSRPTAQKSMHSLTWLNGQAAFISLRMGTFICGF